MIYFFLNHSTNWALSWSCNFVLSLDPNTRFLFLIGSSAPPDSNSNPFWTVFFTARPSISNRSPPSASLALCPDLSFLPIAISFPLSLLFSILFLTSHHLLSVLRREAVDLWSLLQLVRTFCSVIKSVKSIRKYLLLGVLNFVSRIPF